MLLLVLACAPADVPLEDSRPPRRPDTADSGGSDSAADGVPRLVVPAVVDFGTVTLGETATQTLVVRNEGTGPLTIHGVTWVSAEPDFTLDDRGPFTGAAVLAPGEEGALSLGYTPDTESCSGVSVFVSSDDPERSYVEVPVVGCGYFEGALARFVVNVDDVWNAWLDGSPFTASGAGDWSTPDTIEWALAPGEHVIALQGQDTSGPGGFIAGLYLDDAPFQMTEDGGDWQVTGVDPGTGWEQPEFDDGDWEPAPGCSDVSSWGSDQSGGLEGDGATWIWSSDDCYTPEWAWFRLRFVVP